MLFIWKFKWNTGGRETFFSHKALSSLWHENIICDPGRLYEKKIENPCCFLHPFLTWAMESFTCIPGKISHQYSFVLYTHNKMVNHLLDQLTWFKCRIFKWFDFIFVWPFNFQRFWYGSIVIILQFASSNDFVKKLYQL